MESDLDEVVAEAEVAPKASIEAAPELSPGAGETEENGVFTEFGCDGVAPRGACGEGDKVTGKPGAAVPATPVDAEESILDALLAGCGRPLSFPKGTPFFCCCCCCCCC